MLEKKKNLKRDVNIMDDEDGINQYNEKFDFKKESMVMKKCLKKL